MPYAAPSPPINVNATAIPSTSIIVTWSRPITTNGSIKFYEVTFYPTDIGTSGSMTKIVTIGTSTTLYNLMASTIYTILVRAFTVVLSEPSNSVMEKTLNTGIYKDFIEHVVLEGRELGLIFLSASIVPF